jgi:hypothetical protein
MKPALPAFLVCCLCAPLVAMAGGPAWEDFLAESEPAVQILGAIGACANAVKEPQGVIPVFAGAGWERADEFDGTVGFQTPSTYVMFWTEPGFCMVETTDFNTDGLTALLASFDIAPSGTDADGCTQFTLPDTDVVATLTGGGNDPQCTSPTEAALRFEPAP